MFLALNLNDLTFIGILSALGVGLYLLSLLLISLVLLTKKRNPTASVAWMLSIIFVPILGGLLFLLFGLNRVQRRTASKIQARMSISRHLPEFSIYQALPGETPFPELEGLIQLASRIASYPLTNGNRVQLLTDTNQTQAMIEQAVRKAEKWLHLEYYIFRPDETGTRLRDLLIERAKEGVEIRFLYDGFGSITMRRKWLQPMIDAGIKVAMFLPSSSVRERFSINLRTHRKILISDGEVGFTGGVNIGDEYQGKNPHLGYWRDTHLELHGPSVNLLHQIFVEDWFYATGEQLTDEMYFPLPEGRGSVCAHVLGDGPDQDWDMFHMLMFSALNEARKQIILTASFFVPPESLLTALQAAALRGVHVRLLVNGTAEWRWTLWAARSYYEELLQAGVEIYEFRQGMLHSKTLTIDGKWSMVGSPNFDFRSLFLNFEVGMIMYDSKIAAQLEEAFLRDLERSVLIDPERWNRRRIPQRLMENFCRLFSPVL